MIHNDRMSILPFPRDLSEEGFAFRDVLELARKSKLAELPTTEMLLQYDAPVHEVLKACEQNLLARKPCPKELFECRCLVDDKMKRACTVVEMLDAIKRGLVFPKPIATDLIDYDATADDVIYAASNNLLGQNL